MRIGVRVVRIMTNETCRHRCRFCHTRRDGERASVASPAAIAARIDEAVRGGARQLVLTGGEPSLRRDLHALVRRAKTSSTRVVLETNGSNIDEEAALRLAAAGLDGARVHLPAWGSRLDEVVRHAGAWTDLERAVSALDHAGVELEVAVPVVRDNLGDVPSLPQKLHAAGWPVRRIWISIPLEAPLDDALAPLPAAIAAIEQLTAVARNHGISAALEPGTFVPPCLFQRPSAVAHLYAMSAGGANRTGWRRLPPCASCVVADRCPGMPESVDATPRPITHDRIRRRLTVISSTEEQVARELVTHEIYRRPDGSTVPAAIVRINFHCNQACWFCFVSTHLPPASETSIHACIDDIGRRRGVLVLSGGEPTLHPDLPALVRRGKQAGAREVELQTNAIKLADRDLVQALEEAGVDIAFVSLHGACADTSDGITRAPGTFERTVVGLDNLARSQIAVRINFVLCGPNHREFPDLVRLVASRWPNAAITVSFVGLSTDLVPRSQQLVPRYADVLPDLERGLAIAAEHDIEVEGFDSMCGIPLCLVPGDRRRFADLAPIPPGYDGGEFIRSDACRRCVLEDRCFGLRRGYAEMYGTAELTPITPAFD